VSFRHSLAPVLGALLAAALLVPAAALAHEGDGVVTDHIDRGPMLPTTLERPLARAAAASPWCPSSADPRANADSGADADRPRYEVVYTFPADRENRVARLGPDIDAAVSADQQAVADESGGLRTVRFHRGTPCSATGLAIGVVALPKTRDQYVVDGVPDLVAVRGAVWTAIGDNHAAARNVLIYADYLGGDSGLLGQGEMWQGESADDATDSVYDDGGLSAVVWAPQDDTDFLSSLPATVLHEVGHTLGAVSPNSPHGSGGFHCDDGVDVMCYDDGTLREPMYDRCPAPENLVGARFDCGHDDYFSPNPAPGSYLATHLNVFNSTFLGACGELGGACTGSPVAAPTQPAATPTKPKSKARKKRTSKTKRRQVRNERKHRSKSHKKKRHHKAHTKRGKRSRAHEAHWGWNWRLAEKR
jgi:hypothetical protein